MASFRGEAGYLYTEPPDDTDSEWNVWFEDFVILGSGNSELEALEDAVRHVENIRVLVSDATVRVKESTNANSV